MRFTRSAFGLIKAFAVVLALALPVLMAASAADARVGGGRSYGSRGSHTYSAPPVTNTAPNATTNAMLGAAFDNVPKDC